MARNITQSKSLRDGQAGQNSAAAAIPIPELIAIAGGDIRQRFSALQNVEQRTGFLDAITAKIDSNWGNWAKFYEAVAILREQNAYWKAKGFESFEAFWKAKAGPAFQSFKELESIYNFAKTACPELFNIDFEGAKQLQRRLQQLVAVPPLNSYGGVRVKKRLYSGPDEAQAAVAEALTWRNAGGTSLEYRLAKLKRDRPDIAARVLAGEFFVLTGKGQTGIDMAAAEREAYGEAVVSKTRKKPLDVGQNVARVIRAAGRSSVARQSVINELQAIPWVVDALRNGKRRR